MKCGAWYAVAKTMIKFIVGKPGGGKSYLALRWVVEELVHGSRPVVTNLPLVPERLNEFIQEKHPSKTVDLVRRLVIIPDAEVPKFYLNRVTARMHEQPENRLCPVDFSTKNDAGIFYVLDEVHIFFNARRWMDTGFAVLFYNSQHRKFGDDVICITQHVEKVDKTFRMDAQDFTFVRNLGKEKRGPFRLPLNRIVSRVYQDAKPGQGDRGTEGGMFEVDVKGLGTCYETARGVGVIGTRADVGERRKGISIYWFPVFILLAIVAVFYGAKGLNFGVQKGVASFRPSSGETVKALAGGPPAPPVSLPFVPPVVTKPGAVGVVREALADEPLTVTGVVKMGERTKVFLSDGSSEWLGSGAVARIGDEGAVVGKQKIGWRRPVPVPVVPVVPASSGSVIVRGPITREYRVLDFPDKGGQ